MKHSVYFSRIIVLAGLLLLSGAAASAQVVSSRRIPTGILTRTTTGPMTRTAPNAEQQNTMEADGIRDVEVTFKNGRATIKFRARPNISPTVELGTEPPVKGLGDQLEFKIRAGFSFTRNGFGEPIYRADFPLQPADPGTRFYYLITVAPEDSAPRQAHGYFDMP